MNDILAQVATNTDHARNVGNAILYECVNTIMSIEAEGGLRVLAINVLGRFLQNKDNNIRYVALNTLSKVVTADLEAVQRHRNTIVDCLKDPDVSIRKRALDLIFALVNESNIKILAHELVNFLQTASPEFRSELTAKLCAVTEKYAPNKRWQVDTILRVMSIAGTYVPEETAANLIALVASHSDVQSYAVQKMYVSLQTDFSQNILAQVSAWCIGEFGDMLVSPNNPVPDAEPLKVSEHEVIDILEKIMKFPGSNVVTKQYIISALMKLTTRFTQSLPRLKEIINTHRASIEVEVQQRANEFTKLFNWPNVIPKLFEKIPVTDANSSEPIKTPAVATRQGTSIIDWESESVTPGPAKQTSGQAVATSPAPDLLEQLFGASPTPTPSTAPTTPLVSTGLDLNSLLLGPVATTSSPVIGFTNPPSIAPTPILSTSSTSSNNTNFIGYNKNGLVAQCELIRNPQQPNMFALNVAFSNSTSSVISGFEMKAAVPKQGYIKMQVAPPSGNILPANNGGKVTQAIKLLNSLPGEKPLALKIKLDYQQNGNPVSDISDLSFPNGV